MDKLLKRSSGNPKQDLKDFQKFVDYFKKRGNLNQRYKPQVTGFIIFDEDEEIGGIWIPIDNFKTFYAGDILAHIKTGWGVSRRLSSSEKFRIINGIYEELVNEYAINYEAINLLNSDCPTKCCEWCNDN